MRTAGVNATMSKFDFRGFFFSPPPTWRYSVKNDFERFAPTARAADRKRTSVFRYIEIWNADTVDTSDFREKRRMPQIYFHTVNEWNEKKSSDYDGRSSIFMRPGNRVFKSFYFRTNNRRILNYRIKNRICFKARVLETTKYRILRVPIRTAQTNHLPVAGLIQNNT